MSSPDWDFAARLRALLDGQNKRLFQAAKERDFLLMERRRLTERIEILEERVQSLSDVEDGPPFHVIVAATLATVASAIILWP